MKNLEEKIAEIEKTFNELVVRADSEKGEWTFDQKVWPHLRVKLSESYKAGRESALDEARKGLLQVPSEQRTINYIETLFSKLREETK